MTYKVYSGGIWKDINAFYVRNNNSWQEADTVYEKRSGIWEIIYDKGPYNWTGASASGFGFAIFGENAFASASFFNTGEFESFSGPYSETNESFTYAPASKVSSLFIRYNPTTSIPTDYFSGSSFNFWESLSTTASWSLNLPYGIVNSAFLSGTILLGRGSLPDPVIVASGTLSLAASVQSIG